MLGNPKFNSKLINQFLNVIFTLSLNCLLKTGLTNKNQVFPYGNPNLPAFSTLSTSQSSVDFVGLVSVSHRNAGIFLSPDLFYYVYLGQVKHVQIHIV